MDKGQLVIYAVGKSHTEEQMMTTGPHGRSWTSVILCLPPSLFKLYND